MHSFISERNHEGLDGRALGPLSPPVITQSIALVQPLRLSGPSNGSAEMKRTLAGIAASSGSWLSAPSLFSGVFPIQTLSGQPSIHGTLDITRSGRFVSRSQSSDGVASI